MKFPPPPHTHKGFFRKYDILQEQLADSNLVVLWRRPQGQAGLLGTAASPSLLATQNLFHRPRGFVHEPHAILQQLEQPSGVQQPEHFFDVSRWSWVSEPTLYEADQITSEFAMAEPNADVAREHASTFMQKFGLRQTRFRFSIPVSAVRLNPPPANAYQGVHALKDAEPLPPDSMLIAAHRLIHICPREHTLVVSVPSESANQQESITASALGVPLESLVM